MLLRSPLPMVCWRYFLDTQPFAPAFVVHAPAIAVAAPIPVFAPPLPPPQPQHSPRSPSPAHIGYCTDEDDETMADVNLPRPSSIFLARNLYLFSPSYS